MNKETLLIIDDVEINIELLSEILKNDYNIISAKNGVEGLKLIYKYKNKLAAVLLDLNMPILDGFGVLDKLKKEGLINSVPVIIISSDDSVDTIVSCFDKGVYDFIPRPFNARIIKKRVDNAYLLGKKEKSLYSSFFNQISEREKELNALIQILSHVIGFSNSESKQHILNLSIITQILLENLRKNNEKYSYLDDKTIHYISLAAALHDIGKIGVDSAILNKPGKLTKEEFEQIKMHPIIGSIILSDKVLDQNDLLVKYAYQICRWHHEKWDGTGYPDGKKEDQIPLCAQIVAIADCYDALTQERCYKKAYDSNTAVKMICNGECGTFNPELLLILKLSEKEIKKALHKWNDINSFQKQSIVNIIKDILKEN